MILGSDVFEENVLDGNFTEENGIHFRNRVFGWVASGKHPESQMTHSKITSSVCTYNTFDLRKLWELEEIPAVKTQTAENIVCEQHFQDATRVKNNRSVVEMPLKADVKPLNDTSMTFTHLTQKSTSYHTTAFRKLNQPQRNCKLFLTVPQNQTTAHPSIHH